MKQRRIIVLAASGFGTGFLPTMPGTWGSLAVLPVGAVLSWLGGPTTLLVFSLLLFLVGVWSSAAYIQLDGRADPPEITIDEMAAQILILTIVELDFIHYLIAFALFRFFDIVKPTPIPWIENRLPPALGVMVDDIVAALYAMIGYSLFYFIGVV